MLCCRQGASGSEFTKSLVFPVNRAFSNLRFDLKNRRTISYFIRHGQSENNALWERTGASVGRSDDPDLTPLGRRQAEALARFLLHADRLSASNGRMPLDQAGLGLTHLYTSLMVRAVATGTILAESLELPPVAWLDLHEGGGIYLDDENGRPVGRPGKSRADFEERFPGLVLPDTLAEAGWWNRPYEEPEERQLRAQRVAQKLLARHGNTDHRVAFVSHAGFYNHLVSALLGWTRPDGYWFVLNNTALTRIDFTDDHVDVVYMNRVDFLPPELLTEHGG
jgi:2,3-bisphosphoglycerate-dependent phosphoglycerate mutase